MRPSPRDRCVITLVYPLSPGGFWFACDRWTGALWAERLDAFTQRRIASGRVYPLSPARSRALGPGERP